MAMAETRRRWWITASLQALGAGAVVGLAAGWAAAVWQVRAGLRSGFAAATAQLVQLGSEAALTSHNSARFESGNIGAIDHPDPATYVLHLRSDNDDALPNWWRQWFYLRLDEVPLGVEVSITLADAGQENRYLPFFSYDNINWYQFNEAAVTQPDATTRRFRARFTRRTVWLARFVPYTYTRLLGFLDTCRAHPAATLTTIGKTPEGRDVPLLTITEPGPDAGKKRVILHARTHPGEVASSFLLEGLVGYLLGPTPRAQELRRHLIFTILPMLNIDGVVAGNNRVSPEGVNLEGKWYGAPPPDLALDAARTPPEVRTYQSHLAALLRAGPAPTMALNLHASAGEAANQAFTFPHFGPAADGFSPAEAALYAKQIKFISELAAARGAAWLTPPVPGGRGFLLKAIPERWWWEHYGAGVMALTLESTYGLAADLGHWMSPADLRDFGAAVAVAIGRYHGIGALCRVSRAKSLARCR